MAEFTSLRLAHAATAAADDGHIFVQLCSNVDVTNQETSKCFLSCGPDGEVRRWGDSADLDEDRPESFSLSHGAVTAICAKVGVGAQCQSSAPSCEGEHLFAALPLDGDKHCAKTRLQRFALDDGTERPFASAICFGARVNCLDVAASPSLFLALGDSSPMARWVSGADSIYYNFSDHQAPVLSVAVDPMCQFCASSSADGGVRVWSVPLDGDFECVPVAAFANLFDSANDIRAVGSLCKMSWSADGAHLVVPARGEVRVYGRDTWKLDSILRADQTATDVFSLTGFSRAGDALAASTLQGGVVVWRWPSRTVAAVAAYPGAPSSVVCALIWHPSHTDQLVLADTKGHVAALKNVFAKGSAMSARVAEADVDVEQDEDDVVVLRSAPHRSRAFDDDDDELSRASDIGALKAAYDVEGRTDFAEPSRRHWPPPPPAEPSWKPPVKPAAFVPTATPLGQTARFMKWNAVGIIRHYVDGDENAIEVEFHDSSVHAPIHVENTTTQFTMADVSSEALVLGAPSQADTRSRLFVKFFGSWDTNSREWSADLPSGEEMESLCVGDGWLAFASDARLVRLMAVGGVQLSVWCMAGDVLTMAGAAGRLAVAFVSGMVGSELRYTLSLYDVAARRRAAAADELPVALSPAASLVWLGFSDDGAVCTADSADCVRMLSRQLGPCWVRIFDGAADAAPSDHKWFVRVRESPPKVHFFDCKASRYPLLLSGRPLVATAPWNLPLCDQHLEKATYEQNLMISRVRLSNSGAETEELGKSEMDSIIRLFAFACKAAKDARALQVARLMPSAHGVQMLIRYASQSGRVVLADKLNAVAQQKAEEAAELDEPVDENTPRFRRCEEEPEETTLRPAPTNLRRRQATATEGPPPQSPQRQADEGDALPTARLAHNPFKRPASNESAAAAAATNVFERLDRPDAAAAARVSSPPPAKAPRTQRKQLTLLQQWQADGGEQDTAPKKTGFALWFEHNSSALVDEAQTSDDAKVLRLAQQRFRALPADEKQKWNSRAKSVMDELSQP